MKFIIEGTPEELKELIGEGAVLRFIDKDAEEDNEEIPPNAQSALKFVNNVSDATATFLGELDK